MAPVSINTEHYLIGIAETSYSYMGCHLCQKSAQCNIYKCEANVYKCTVTFVYVRQHLYM